MLEKKIEWCLVRGVQKLGGKAYKFVSPGNTGVPDRIVVLPGGGIVFVELKAPGGRLSPNQRLQLATLEQLGAPTAVLLSAEEVDMFLNICREIIKEVEENENG